MSWAGGRDGSEGAPTCRGAKGRRCPTPSSAGAGNPRDGCGRKAVPTAAGEVEPEVPRDLRATLDPWLIAERRRRFPGFGDEVVSTYARGVSPREIVGCLREP